MLDWEMLCDPYRDAGKSREEGAWADAVPPELEDLPYEGG